MTVKTDWNLAKLLIKVAKKLATFDIAMKLEASYEVGNFRMQDQSIYHCSEIISGSELLFLAVSIKLQDYKTRVLIKV